MSRVADSGDYDKTSVEERRQNKKFKDRRRSNDNLNHQLERKKIKDYKRRKQDNEENSRNYEY